MDTLHGKMVLLCDKMCAQVYVTSFGFVVVHPMKADSKIFWTVRIPSSMVAGNSMVPGNVKELMDGKLKRKCLKAQCPILPVKPYTPNVHYAKGAIR
jgi:hypothetical protein